MRRLFAPLALLVFVSAAGAHDVRVRRPLRVPDLPGYRTLQCDLHTHTVFSDGDVWPDVRSEEAWREGLDAVAITDHIEYQPHAADLPTSHERSYEIARPHGEKLDLLVIKGSEVTRSMPPGHLNAIFLESVTRLDVPDWREAVRRAREQGAFVFWNHPGWRGQQPTGEVRWYPEHQELVDQGLLHGIEVVNGRDYYPEAHRLSLEKGLTPLANSDVHSPSNLDYHVLEGDHRPITLAFARERSLAALREALFAGRTAVWSEEVLVGREEYLKPLFEASVHVENPRLSARPWETAYVRVRNNSDLRFVLEGAGAAGAVSAPERWVIAPGGTSLLELPVGRDAPPGRVRLALRYRVTNLMVAPDTALEVDLPLDLEVLPAQPRAK